MFDNSPLEQKEIIDQCRTLIYTMIETKNPQA
ncbi:hypothetical protein HAP32_02093 [Serratia fonticola]|jgi:hypothetical protein|nr:hypothetical protein HAP32_02093 [Serratia fonticola]